MSELYDRIKRVCESKGVSVSRMCLDLGMSKSVMSDLNKGKKDGLRANTITKFAHYLDVSVDELLGIEQKEKPAENDELSEYLKNYTQDYTRK